MFPHQQIGRMPRPRLVMGCLRQGAALRNAPMHRSPALSGGRLRRLGALGSALVLLSGCPRASTPSAMAPPSSQVTSVPFQLYYGFIASSQPKWMGIGGTFLLDTGAPFITLNSQYVQAGPHGLDTVIAAPKGPTRENVNVTVHTIRVGTLLQPVDSLDVGPRRPSADQYTKSSPMSGCNGWPPGAEVRGAPRPRAVRDDYRLSASAARADSP